MVSSKSASLSARKPSSRTGAPPTLLTRTSTAPWSSTAWATRRAGPSGAPRSTASASTPSIAGIASMLRAPTTTFAPSAASVRATANPMPLLAPVTTATLSCSSRSMRPTLRRGQSAHEHAGELVGDRGVLALEQAAAQRRAAVGQAQRRDVPAVGGQASKGGLDGDRRIARNHVDDVELGLDDERDAVVGTQPVGDVQRGGPRRGEVPAEPLARERQRPQGRPERRRRRAGARALQADLAEVQIAGGEVRVRRVVGVEPADARVREEDTPAAVGLQAVLVRVD